MTVLLKLILAHALGDFFPRPQSWTDAIAERKWKAWQFYLQSLVHGLLAFALVWDIHFAGWAVVVVVLHLLAGSLKWMLSNDATERLFFFVEQIMCFAGLAGIWLCYDHVPLMIQPWLEQHLLLIVSLFLMTYPASAVIRELISGWSPKADYEEPASLENAGKYIGIIERLFTFVFVITNHWEAIGFLLAAKSVFRFGDLKESKDRKLTEYILIGTLLSFGLAIAAGMLYLKLKAA